jgi:SAM-dependent methyltransferase
VGFGGGATLEVLVQEKGCGYAGGLDASPEMVRAAERRFASWIAEGRMADRQGTAEEIPWPGAEFDRALSVNSLFYWPDPARAVREIRRVLRPGGVLVLGLRDKTAADKIGIGRLGYWSPTEEEIEALLADAGFEQVTAEPRRRSARGFHRDPRRRALRIGAISSAIASASTFWPSALGWTVSLLSARSPRILPIASSTTGTWYSSPRRS